mmetsp:Transcript_37561/g.86762  ORF Transcript_37561/g.86762 Transcript_37561/m.86762 type:complete len:552 (-) Transcript_37561:66-1721(-)|eukprot:1882587-Amphidinium_carterae.5
MSVQMVASKRPLLQGEQPQVAKAAAGLAAEARPETTHQSSALFVAGLLLVASVMVVLVPLHVLGAGRPSLRNGQGFQRKDGLIDSKFFVWLADIHADPYYGTSSQACKTHPASLTSKYAFGVVGCDPPTRLMEESVKAVAAVLLERNITAEFVVHSGDLVRHNMEEMPSPAANVSSIVRAMSEVITTAFHFVPEKFMLTPIGNTDTPEDYLLAVNESQLENPWLANLAQAFFDVGGFNDACTSTYNFGGYCSAFVGGIQVLSLDTLIYSRFHKPKMEPLTQDPFHQFAWLKRQLKNATAAKHKVWIVGHIPPGIETYGYTELWHAAYVERYLQIVTDPELAPAIAAQLFGHVHSDEFRLLADAPPDTGPILLTGALSPVYINNPSFRIMEYSATTGSLLNVQMYWAALPTADEPFSTTLSWQLGYDLAATYAPLATAQLEGAITQASYMKLRDEFLAAGNGTSEALEAYGTWYKTKFPSDFLSCVKLKGEACLRAYLCALVVSNLTRYDACIESDAVLQDRRKLLETLTLPSQDFFRGARSAHQDWLTRAR